MAKWLALIILAAGSFGCGGSGTPTPIEVGLVADLTGADRRDGIQAQRGIGLALDELNKDVKKPLRVRLADTQGKREAIETQAVRLLAVNQVKALIGGGTPEELLSLDAGRTLGTEDRPVFVPILSPCGWRAPGTSTDAILIGMSPQAQGKVLARFAVQELKADLVLILVKRSAGSSDLLVESFKTELREAKGDAKSGDPVPQLLTYGTDVHLRDLLPRIEKEKPQAVLLVGPTVDLHLLSEKLEQPQPALLFAGPDGSLRPSEWDTSARIYFASAFASENENAEFADRYRKAYQDDPDVHSALAYESMKLLGNALQKSNDALTNLRDELFKIKDLPGLIGPIGFDDKQQLRRSLVVRRLKALGIRKGETPSEAKKYLP